MTRIGFAKRDISAWEPEMAMLGWGRTDHNRIKGVAEPLYARAMVIERDGVRLAYVVADLLFVSMAVRQYVLARLAAERPDLDLDASRVVLSATHTHSGPSGFSHYFWLNLASPGYSSVVFEAVAQGVFDAIVAAADAAEPGTLRLVRGEVPRTEGIAFNRSWFAYSRNPEVEPVPYARREEATDSTMTSLVAVDTEGRPFGAVVWYALHGTCVHADNHLLHPDNKGLAAGLVDEAMRGRTGRSFDTLFAQEAAGDVSPNFRFHRGRGLVIGHDDDDLRSVARVASVQAKYAAELIARAPDDGAALDGPIEAVTERVDFSRAPVAERFAPRAAARTTSAARIGLSMAQGTVEGPGPLLPFHRLVRRVTQANVARDASRGLIRRGRSHDPKVPLLELGAGGRNRFLGRIRVERLAPIAKRDPIFGYVHGVVASGAAGSKAWIAQVLPIQLVRIGPLALATTPFEITTIAGRRLRETILASLGAAGVEFALVNGYTNGYSGYLTTFEEYQCQHYEAGYTLFGPWSLAALQTAIASLGAALVRGDRGDWGPETDRFTPEELAGRLFSTRVAWAG